MGKSGSEDQTPKPGGSGVGSRQLDTSWICRLKLSWTKAWGGARHVVTCLFAPPLLGGPSHWYQVYELLKIHSTEKFSCLEANVRRHAPKLRPLRWTKEWPKTPPPEDRRRGIFSVTTSCGLQPTGVNPLNCLSAGWSLFRAQGATMYCMSVGMINSEQERNFDWDTCIYNLHQSTNLQYKQGWAPLHEALTRHEMNVVFSEICVEMGYARHAQFNSGCAPCSCLAHVGNHKMSTDHPLKRNLAPCKHGAKGWSTDWTWSSSCPTNIYIERERDTSGSEI